MFTERWIVRNWHVRLISGAVTGMAAATPMPRLVWHCNINKLHQTTYFTHCKFAIFLRYVATNWLIAVCHALTCLLRQKEPPHLPSE